MHLYGWPLSPFVQRPLMAARAKGHDLEVKVPPGGTTLSPEFLAISPTGRVPLLALDDGRHIAESAAIAAYLDDTLDGPTLAPADPLARARIREIEALADGHLAAGLRPIMTHVLFRRSDAPEVVAAARVTIDQGLDALNRLVESGPGALPNLGDCALIPFLTLARIIDPVAETWASVSARAHLANYYEGALAHPIARRSIEEMERGFADILSRDAPP